ncbi:MAG: hypothetical protein BWX71_01584 [Deltaproteobacteria bacterium ADurb.Bin072]|nr:MAG: hypothetical protein BWX71_01584 [Deltaproteobacteria bacterium ADurb.Bin072]
MTSLDRDLRCSRDLTPAMASILRSPADTLDSETTFTRPIWPVEEQWVPPQSSMDTSPMDTTRTSSAYFSVKSAMAPRPMASSLDRISVLTGRFSSTNWFTMASILSSSSADTAAKWVKSNLSLASLTRDPDWCTWSPKTSRNARWSRCVALWWRMMLLRLPASTTSFTASPVARLPERIRTRCTITSCSVLVVSRTSALPWAEKMVPVSPTWPPDSP